MSEAFQGAVGFWLGTAALFLLSMLALFVIAFIIAVVEVVREEKRKKRGRMSEPNLIDITNDDELMDRVLKKSAEMQEETLKKAEEEE